MQTLACELALVILDRPLKKLHVLRAVRVNEMTYLSAPVLNRKFGGVALL